MILSSLLIVVGFVLLIKGADYLVNGSSSLAKRYNVSDMAIGLTIVAMGTSMPELVVSLFSGSEHRDASYGNIIGSNIFNMYFILGVCALIYPLTVLKNSLWIELPYSLLAAVVFFVLVNDQMFWGAEVNSMSRLDGIIMLVMFAAFLYYIYKTMQRTDDAVDSSGGGDEIEIFSSVKTTLMIVFGLAGLVFGGKLIVDNAVEIANSFNISDQFIGLTILAIGTSLPELATSAVAAFHKKSDLAVGNIIGSNIFNILFVLGTVGVAYGPVPFDIVMNTDLYIIMVGCVILFIFMFTLQKYKLDRAEGALYLVGYVVYSVYLFYNRL